MSERRFKALFLDFYGTVAAGDVEAVESVCQQVVTDFKLDMSAAELTVAWGNRFFRMIETCNHDGFKTLHECECESLIETLKPLVGDVDPNPYADRLYAYWCDPHLHTEAAAAIASIDLPICCVSNADTDHLLAAIEKHSLRFDAILSSEDARCYKPEPAIFAKACEMMNVQPAEVLHVGDSLHSDIEGAQNFGIQAAWICRDRRIHDVGKAHPDYQISRLDEIPALLSKLS